MQFTDDDYPKVPHPADDSLSSAQSRRYWREQGTSCPNQRVDLGKKYLARANNGVIVRCSENHQQGVAPSGNRHL